MDHPKEKHYACQGSCGGSSTEHGTCQAQDCTKSGEALTECNCG